jgi:hypothetical protein
MFTPAQKTMTYLKIAVQGVSGSGKTLSSLMLAKGMADGGKIAVLDTENNSAALYSDTVAFDTANLSAPYSPERYSEIIHYAAKSGYKVLVIDSLSHEWQGIGGILEINEAKAATMRNNSYMAWKESKARHQKMMDAILQSPIHIIATMRQKTEYEQGEDDKGRKVVKKIGLKSVQAPDIEYDFTCVFDLEHGVINGKKPFSLSKDRTENVFGDDLFLTENTGMQLINWLKTCKPEYVFDFDSWCDEVGTIDRYDALMKYYNDHKHRMTPEQNEQAKELCRNRRAAIEQPATIEVPDNA